MPPCHAVTNSLRLSNKDFRRPISRALRTAFLLSGLIPNSFNFTLRTICPSQTMGTTISAKEVSGKSAIEGLDCFRCLQATDVNALNPNPVGNPFGALPPSEQQPTPTRSEEDTQNCANEEPTPHETFTVLLDSQKLHLRCKEILQQKIPPRRLSSRKYRGTASPFLKSAFTAGQKVHLSGSCRRGQCHPAVVLGAVGNSGLVGKLA